MKKTRRKNPSVFPSVLSISMVLVMLGIFLLLALSLSKVSDYLTENVALTVYMHMDASEEEILSLQKEMEARPEVKAVVYTSQAQGAKDFSDHLGQDFVTSLGYNPIPATLDITIRSSDASQSQMAALKQELSGNKIVRESLYPTNILDKIEKNSRRIMTGTLALGILFGIIAITLINSTIRLDLYSHRFIIRSMQLVGAKRWFIIRPFIGKTLAYGVYGFIVAGLILSGIFYFAYLNIPELEELHLTTELAIIGGSLLFTSLLLTLFCSYFATNKYLKLKIEELY